MSRGERVCYTTERERDGTGERERKRKRFCEDLERSFSSLLVSCLLFSSSFGLSKMKKKGRKENKQTLVWMEI
jgi:hypothetical protein